MLVYSEDCQVRDFEHIYVSVRNLNVKNVMICVSVCTREKFWVIGRFDSKFMICAPLLLSFCNIGLVLLGFTLVNTVSSENVLICLLIVSSGPHEYKSHLLHPARFAGLDYAKASTLSTLVAKEVFYFGWKWMVGWMQTGMV